MKKLIFFILFVFLSFNLFAKKVELDNAKLVAKNYYFAQLELLEGTKNEFKKIEDVKFDKIFEVAEKGNTLMYIINIEEGFVIVAADDLVEPILGFSHKNNYSGENLPPALVDLLEFYKAQITYAIEKQIDKRDNVTDIWENLLGIGGLKSGDCDIWPKYFYKYPLLSTTWDQGEYYNALCPEDSVMGEDYDYHVYAGCVAIAMAQVMNYWEYPEVGEGSYSYQDDDYGLQSADFENTTYQWSSMPNQLTSHNNAAATLIYHCGVSVDMDYDTGGSEAYTYDIEDALEDYFDYNTSMHYEEKSSYSSSVWEGLLIHELNYNRPMPYKGTGGGGGHSFVLDGYNKTQTESYTYAATFHVNWGWSGSYNGYYSLTDLTPGYANYNYYQAAIIGVIPNTTNFSAPSQPTSITAACSTPFCMSNNYEFSTPRIQGATSYEWQVTGCTAAVIWSNENYVNLYAIRPCSTCTLQVRAKNYAAASSWTNYPFVINYCEDKSGIIDNVFNEPKIISINKSSETIINGELDVKELSIFPNPAKDNINIYLPKYENTEIKLIDLNGVIHQVIAAKNNKIVLNVANLSTGFYILKVISKEGTETRKIEIIK